MVKNLLLVQGDLCLIPGLGRSPEEGNGYPLWYSCVENSMTEEHDGLQSMGSQRVGHDRATNTFIISNEIINVQHLETSMACMCVIALGCYRYVSYLLGELETGQSRGPAGGKD